MSLATTDNKLTLISAVANDLPMHERGLKIR